MMRACARSQIAKFAKLDRARRAKTALEPFHLIWHFDGAMRGKRFADWDECEAFSKRLIEAGLVPKLTADSACPYDGLATAADINEVTL